MRTHKLAMVLVAFSLVAAHALALGSAGVASPAAIAAKAAVASPVAPKVLAAVDIRGIDNLIAAAEELVGPSHLPPGQARQTITAFGGMGLGIDPMAVLDTAAVQRLVVFKKGDDIGFALLVVPAGGPAKFIETLKQAWPALNIPAASTKAFPAGTACFVPEQLDNDRIFVMPRDRTQVVILSNQKRAGIRPAELWSLLDSLPPQLAVEGQIALSCAVDAYIEFLRQFNDNLPDNRRASQFDTATASLKDVKSFAFGLGIRDGALLLNSVCRFHEDSAMASKYAALTGTPSRAASSVCLPGAVLANVIHTYPDNSEAADIAKLNLLDIVSHAAPDPKVGSAAAAFWRMIFDISSPFGPDFSLAIYSGPDGNELPTALYLQLADSSFRDPKVNHNYFSSLPKRFFSFIDSLEDDPANHSYGPGRTEPLPIRFDPAGTREISGIDVDTWNIILTDCEENQSFNQPLPYTVGSFDVAWLPDAIVIGDAGDATDMGMFAIINRAQSDAIPRLGELADFRAAMPIDTSTSVNLGYIQVFNFLRAFERFVDALKPAAGSDVAEIKSGLKAFIPDTPGTIAYTSHVIDPTLLHQTLGFSVSEIQSTIRWYSAQMGMAEGMGQQPGTTIFPVDDGGPDDFDWNVPGNQAVDSDDEDLPLAE